MTTQKYDYHCGRCGGLVAEPMKAYGYSRQFCHCPEPTPAVFKPQQFMTTHEDILQQVEADKNADYQKATQTEEQERMKKVHEVGKCACCDNSMKLLELQRTRLKEEIEQLVIEDVPHRYQERLLAALSKLTH